MSKRCLVPGEVVCKYFKQCNKRSPEWCLNCRNNEKLIKAKKKNYYSSIFKKPFFLSILLVFILFTGCGNATTVNVNVENSEELSNTILGKDSLVKIGNGLYYDSTTRIVYLKFGTSQQGYLSPYYAPNGLPYKYNPETNTFEEIKIEVSEVRQ